MFDYKYGTLWAILLTGSQFYYLRPIALIAIQYSKSFYKDRYNRSKDAFIKSGVTIFHTTMYATISGLFIFHWFTSIYKMFGVIILFVLLYTYFFSIHGFNVFLRYLGPKQGWWDIDYMGNWFA